MKPRAQRAQLDGVSVTATVTAAGLDVDGRLCSWLDVDDVDEGDHRVRLVLADGRSVLLTGLGTTHDGFLADLRAARRAVRLPALTVATGDPIITFLSRAPDGWADIHLFAKVLVVEPRQGTPVAVPLPLVEHVDRDGYTVTVTARGLPPTVIRALGVKTDELLTRLELARRDLQAAVTTAYARYDPALEGYTGPDGWAADSVDAGRWWPALRAAALKGARAEQVAVLESLAGARLSVGLYTDGGTECLPFVLAAVGSRVAVEATDADDRATFVFEVPDVARLNAVLVLTSFRREALSLPEDQLGRWAVAARTWPVVREARAALVARVVHDAGWEAGVRTALTRSA